MSSKRGNAKKSQKYQNSMAFRNDLHDTSRKTKALNEMVIGGVCSRCKEQIDWKIKYKKYKPLTQPKKCVRCEQKAVVHAYHIICKLCATDANICAKCGKNEDIVAEPGLSPAEKASQASQLDAELRYLSERKRRTFFRYQAKGCLEEGDGTDRDARLRHKDKELDDDCDRDEKELDDDCDRDESEDVNDSGNELDERTN